MTAQEALVWFGIGVPLCALLLVLVDRTGHGAARRGAVTSGYAPAAPPRPVGPEPAPDVVAPAATVVAPVSDAGAPRRSPRPVAVLEATVRPPRPVRNPWAPGDNVLRPIVTGAAPGAATVRKRAWSAYAMLAPVELYGAANVERLQRGRPPLRYNPLTESTELMQVRIDEVGRALLRWSGDDEVCDPFEVVPA